MGRRLLAGLVAASVAASFPSAVSSQATAPTSAIWQSVNNTIAASLRRRGLEGHVEDTLASLNPAYQASLPDDVASQSWMNWLLRTASAAFWYPLNLFKGDPADGYKPCDGSSPNQGYCSGGAGASGDERHGVWAPLLCFDFKLEKRGNYYMVPSIPLVGSGPMSEAMSPIVHDTTVTVNGVSEPHASDSPGAAALWHIHQTNSRASFPLPNSWGVWKIAPGTNGYTGFQARRLNASGQMEGLAVTPGRVASAWSKANFGNGGVYENTKDCPPEGVSGDGRIDYYLTKPYRADPNQYITCTFYIKNFSISPSGYAYNPLVPMSTTTADWNDYVNSYQDFANCPIDPELIRLISDRIFKIATTLPGYKGAPYEEIKPHDVRNGGTQPTGKDLTAAKPPTSADPALPEANPTVPDSSPPPPTGEGTEYESPTQFAPNLSAPELKMPDWFPGLPSLSVPTGSGQCPTWEFDAFETHHVFNHHCPYIDQNRAVIGGIMIVLFTIGAAIIVMRA